MSNQANIPKPDSTLAANTPVANTPSQFDAQGFPIPQQTDVNTPTGLAIDGIPTGEEMTEEQINTALQQAMRDDEGSFRPSQTDGKANDGTWTGGTGGTGGTGAAADATTSPPEGTTPDASGVVSPPAPATPAAPAPDGGSGTVDPSLPGAATPPLPPGYILAPIAQYNEFTGRTEIRYMPAPAEDVGNVLGWVNGIAPQDRQQIMEWLEAKRNGIAAPLPTSAASGSGQIPPTSTPVGVGGPGGYPPGYQGLPVQPQGVATPPQIDYSQLDPELAQALYLQQQQLAQSQHALEQVNGRLQSFEAQQADFYARQAAQDRAALQSTILNTTASFIESHGFTPEQGEALSQAAANMQILPTMHAKFNGDTAAAVNATLEAAMWTNPEFRSHAIQTELTDSLATNAATEERKRKAAAIGSAGGAVPRVAPPASPATKQERERAMVEEIGSHMFNGSAN